MEFVTEGPSDLRCDNGLLKGTDNEGCVMADTWPTGLLGYHPSHWKSAELERARRPDPPSISPHLVNPAQTVLLQPRRDRSIITPDKVLPTR
ncbi:hypothetical protein ACTMTI_42780 [Nonomuraea sp. H19]|uniref:hypothetical protein n=1 Tax=Nonomuraea sp. H19 TaxID=3452206 RepID=UPI003F88BA40